MNFMRGMMPRTPGFRELIGLVVILALMPIAVVQLFELLAPYALWIVGFVVVVIGLKYALYRWRRL